MTDARGAMPVESETDAMAPQWYHSNEDSAQIESDSLRNQRLPTRPVAVALSVFVLLALVLVSLQIGPRSQRRPRNSHTDDMNVVSTPDSAKLPVINEDQRWGQEPPKPLPLYEQASVALSEYKSGDHAAPRSGDGGFETNAAETRSFSWTSPTKTVEDAFNFAFNGKSDWTDVVYDESPKRLSKQSLVTWVQDELLGGADPFAAHGGKVPVPYTAQPAQGGKFPTPRDQLEPGQWATYSRRQLCFIVAKSLIGAKTAGYENGLERFMWRKTGSGCTAAGGDFGRAWWTLLAACAADPGLESGAQGPMLMVAKANDLPSMQSVREKADDATLSAAGLRVCRYDDGDVTGVLPGITAVPPAACTQPTVRRPGRDFMTGGLMGQAAQDISAKFLGGYVYGNVCGLGGGQDERMMVYFPEVSALTFFLSEAGPDGTYGPPQVRQPAWVLGARRLRTGLDGTARFQGIFEVDTAAPLNSDLVTVNIAGRSASISRSTPFLAFMSENQGMLGWPESASALKMARSNRAPQQRETRTESDHSFDKQVRAWYRAVALSSYAPAVQTTLKAVVTSIGTGPWGAGLWWGDSQVSLIASWVGHAAAAASWDGALPLDYYLYSAFTENPGNQCLVHSGARCQACSARCAAAAKEPGSETAFWLPGAAFTQGGAPPSPCAVGPSGEACGSMGLEDVVSRYSSKSAGELWANVEAAMRGAGADTSRPVFDLLMQ